MKALHEHLTWLPTAPDDISERIKQASDAKCLRHAASFALDENQLHKLYKRLSKYLVMPILFSMNHIMMVGIISRSSDPFPSSYLEMMNSAQGLKNQTQALQLCLNFC